MTVLWIGLRGFGQQHVRIDLADRVMAVFSIPAHYGYAGVMLFFLLSGFVIHFPFAGGHREFAFFPYLARRFFRIYPPYAVAILVSLAIALCLPSAYHFQLQLTGTDPTQIVKSFAMLQNYPHVGGPYMELAGNQPASNMALWSLPVEMELYLAYPLLLLAARSMSPSVLSAAVALVSIAATAIDIAVAAPAGAAPNLANYQPTFLHYWLIWAAGAWLAERVATRSVPRWSAAYGWMLAAVGVCAILARTQLHLARDLEDFVWGAAFFLIFLWLVGTDADRKIRWLRPLSFVGQISYSVYLIHIPTFLALAALWGRSHATLSSNFGVCLVAVALVLPIAAIMYYTVERPSMELGRRLSTAHRRVGAKQAS